MNLTYYTKQHFVPKNPELLSESWTLHWNSFFKLSLGDLDENLKAAGYKREQNKKQFGTVRKAKSRLQKRTKQKAMRDSTKSQ